MTLRVMSCTSLSLRRGKNGGQFKDDILKIGYHFGAYVDWHQMFSFS